MDFRAFIPLIAAVVLALITFWVVRRANFTIQRSAANRLDSFAEQDRRGVAVAYCDPPVPLEPRALVFARERLSFAAIAPPRISRPASCAT